MMSTKHAISPISPTFGIQHSKRSRTTKILSDNDELTLDEVTDVKVDLPVSAIVSNLESLPNELLQEVAWLAHNPLLYLVSKTITSKLFPLKDYEHDLSLLLWCDRDQKDEDYSRSQRNDINEDDEETQRFFSNIGPLAWCSIPDKQFPWKTSVAQYHNPKPDFEQRLQLQKDVFDLFWLTDIKFRNIGHALMEFWLDHHFKEEDFSSDGLESIREARQNFELLHDHASTRPHDATFTPEYTERSSLASICLMRGCKVNAEYHWRRSHPMWIRRGDSKFVTHSLMDNLYIPTYIFDPTICSSNDLLPLMRYCRAPDTSRCMDTARSSFSRTDAVLALKKSVRSNNQLAFIRYFYLLLSQLACKDVPSLDQAILQVIGESSEDPPQKLSQFVVRLAADCSSVWELRPGGAHRESFRWTVATKLFNIFATRCDTEEIYTGLL